MSKEAVERLIVRAENAAIRLPLSKGIVFGLCRSLRALSARLAEVEAERDRQYDENVDRIAQQAAAEARAEAAEAERDAAMTEALSLAKTLHANHYSDVPQWEPFDYPAGVISQIDNMVAGIIESAKAERDALQAKLALAVEALGYYAEGTGGDGYSIYAGGGVMHNNRRNRARSTLAQLTADTAPDPRIEGWNAAIEAAVDAVADYPRAAPEEQEWTRYDEQIEHSQQCIRAIPCPYTPKEGKDDE